MAWGFGGAPLIPLPFVDLMIQRTARASARRRCLRFRLLMGFPHYSDSQESVRIVLSFYQKSPGPLIGLGPAIRIPPRIEVLLGASPGSPKAAVLTGGRASQRDLIGLGTFRTPLHTTISGVPDPQPVPCCHILKSSAVNRLLAVAAAENREKRS